MHSTKRPPNGFSLSVTVLATAFAAWLSLPYATFFSSALSSLGRFSSEVANLMWFVAMAGQCCMFVYQIARGRHTCDEYPLGSRGGIVVASVAELATLLMMALTALMEAVPLELGVVAAAVNGLSKGYVYVTWMFILAHVEKSSGKSDIVASVSFLVAMAASAVLRATSQAVSLVFLFLLAAWCMTVLCLTAFRVRPIPDDEVVGTGHVGENPSVAKAMVALAVVWASFMCVELPAMRAPDTGVAWEMPTFAIIGALVVASSITYVTLRFSRAVTFASMLRIGSCFVGAGLALSLLFPESIRLAGYPCAFCGMTIMNLTVWIVGARMVLVSPHDRAQAVAAAGPRLAIFAVMLVVNPLYPFLTQQIPSLQTVALFLLLVMMAVLKKATISSVALVGSDEPATSDGRSMTLDERSVEFEGSQLENGDLDPALAAIARRCGLTRRETEVFSLLARGRDAEYIRNRLHISRNTANTHIAHIYRKASVHSHQELLDMIEREGL